LRFAGKFGSKTHDGYSISVLNEALLRFAGKFGSKTHDQPSDESSNLTNQKGVQKEPRLYLQEKFERPAKQENLA